MAPKKGLQRMRAAFDVFMTEAQAAVREIEEAAAATAKQDDVPTVRPKSQPNMPAVHVPKVDVVRLPR